MNKKLRNAQKKHRKNVRRIKARQKTMLAAKKSSQSTASE